MHGSFVAVRGKSNGPRTRAHRTRVCEANLILTRWFETRRFFSSTWVPPPPPREVEAAAIHHPSQNHKQYGPNLLALGKAYARLTIFPVKEVGSGIFSVRVRVNSHIIERFCSNSLYLRLPINLHYLTTAPQLTICTLFNRLGARLPTTGAGAAAVLRYGEIYDDVPLVVNVAGRFDTSQTPRSRFTEEQWESLEKNGSFQWNVKV